MATETNTVRSLSTIAAEIRKDWGSKLNPAAAPYLNAMSALNTVKDKYFLDDGKGIVAYFLSNATSWRGETAKRIKKELNAMIK